MKRINIFPLFIAALFMMNCQNSSSNSEKTDHPETEIASESNTNQKTITVKMEPKSDSNLSGTVVFTQSGDNVTMKATINGLSEGKHAIHIHETGDCSAADGTSAGGHWNPTNQPHGKWGDAKGYHKGDIGNFKVDANGKGAMDFSTDEWCIGCNDPQKDITGKAVIIHAGVDDFTSQPAGAAGKRIGCGIIN